MKNSNQQPERPLKLTLHKETLRILSQQESARVDGGGAVGAEADRAGLCSYHRPETCAGHDLM